MTNKIAIKSKFKEYSVEFVDSFDELKTLAKKPETFLVIDRIVYNIYKDEFPVFDENRLYLIDALEHEKTIETALCICEKVTSMPSKRNTHLVSIGGGITQDITGFVASNLYRGIYWTFYPTTLLAACDSCIGGKSSLNYKGFKNLLGTFFPPDKICILQAVFHTLSSKDYCSGLGEVLKFNVIAGKESFYNLERDIDDILNHNYDKLEDYVNSSLLFKKEFIEEDEFDRGIRVLLNFAHTFGHAYEVISNYEIPHGSAVTMGMITANYISMKRGYMDKQYMERIEGVCKKILAHIIVDDNWFDISNIMKAIRKDKKQVGDSITAVLIDEDGKLSAHHDLDVKEVKEAVERTIFLCKKRIA